MPKVIKVPPTEATNRQLLVAIYRQLNSLENTVSDLAQSVSDLQAAVDSINARFAGQVQALTQALAEANQVIANEDLDDADRDAALAEALANAQSAADAINAQVEELNAIGAEPETPVEPETAPDEAAPGDPQVEEAPPAPNQDLPTEQPVDQPAAPDQEPGVVEEPPATEPGVPGSSGPQPS